MSEILERVEFRGQNAVAWHQSRVAGRIWEAMIWPGSTLPLIRWNWIKSTDFEVECMSRTLKAAPAEGTDQ